MNYPYILKTSTIKDFFEKIPSLGTPEKVIHKYIYSIGFKSTSDRPIISILEFLGFIDPSSKSPTELYRSYRNRDLSRKILGDAIRKSYDKLFKIYPDAPEKDFSTLRNFFSTHTNLGERALKSVVDTFKTLCSISDFNSNGDSNNYNKNSYLNEDSYQNNKLTVDIHKIELSLPRNRKIQLIMPGDITPGEIERLKILLEAFKDETKNS